jgi:hypothetical protein
MTEQTDRVLRHMRANPEAIEAHAETWFGGAVWFCKNGQLMSSYNCHQGGYSDDIMGSFIDSFEAQS